MNQNESLQNLWYHSKPYDPQLYDTFNIKTFKTSHWSHRKRTPGHKVRASFFQRAATPEQPLKFIYLLLLFYFLFLQTQPKKNRNSFVRSRRRGVGWVKKTSQGRWEGLPIPNLSCHPGYATHELLIAVFQWSAQNPFTLTPRPFIVPPCFKAPWSNTGWLGKNRWYEVGVGRLLNYR